MTTRWRQELRGKINVAAKTRHPQEEPVTAFAQLHGHPVAPESLDDLGRARYRRQTLAWVSVLIAVLLGSLPVAVSLGAASIPLELVWKVVGHHLFDWPASVTWSTAEDNIVWRIRVPRALLGAIVGAGLAVAGAVLQAMVRNVLADPYLLGVTSGASTGAAATILFGVGASLGASALTASAFVGALAAAGAVFLIARIGGPLTPIRLVLAGVAVGYGLEALTSFLVLLRMRGRERGRCCSGCSAPSAGRTGNR